MWQEKKLSYEKKIQIVIQENIVMKIRRENGKQKKKKKNSTTAARTETGTLKGEISGVRTNYIGELQPEKL